MAHYVGLLLAPAEGFGLRTKKKLIMLFWLIIGHFWCPVVALVRFSSYLNNFKKNPKSP